MTLTTAIQSFILPKRTSTDATKPTANPAPAPKRKKSFFDRAVPDHSLAFKVLSNVMDSYERTGLDAAKRRLRHQRKQLALHLAPHNREKLDRQLFDMLVEYYVHEE